ncbi:hypothetical protein C8R46DRAFT_1064703 [Mycena filopes]|nr:hypothetical protein C8R46DRAFT_1064703 [Mycena filopes]
MSLSSPSSPSLAQASGADVILRPRPRLFRAGGTSTPTLLLALWKSMSLSLSFSFPSSASASASASRGRGRGPRGNLGCAGWLAGCLDFILEQTRRATRSWVLVRARRPVCSGGRPDRWRTGGATHGTNGGFVPDWIGVHAVRLCARTTGLVELRRRRRGEKAGRREGDDDVILHPRSL